MVKNDEKQEMIVQNDAQKLIKINENEYLYKKDFTAKITTGMKNRIHEELRNNIKKCKEELEKLNDSNYNRAVVEIEEKSAKNLEEYENLLKNLDAVILRETEEEFEQRKKENREETEALIKHSKDGENLAKENLKKMYDAEKEKYTVQLEEQTRLIKIYDECEQ